MVPLIMGIVFADNNWHPKLDCQFSECEIDILHVISFRFFPIFRSQRHTNTMLPKDTTYLRNVREKLYGYYQFAQWLIDFNGFIFHLSHCSFSLRARKLKKQRQPSTHTVLAWWVERETEQKERD